MTNYDHVWGGAQKEWRKVSFMEKHILNVLTVFSWVGMVGVYIALAFVWVTRSDPWVILMIIFMVMWAACGIAAIKIRRSKRKLVMLPK